MTLTDVARELARRMNCTVQPSEDPFQITVRGNGYSFTVAAFFGGWQATLHLPGQPPSTYYAEAVDMLEARLRGKITGRPVE